MDESRADSRKQFNEIHTYQRCIPFTYLKRRANQTISRSTLVTKSVFHNLLSYKVHYPLLREITQGESVSFQETKPLTRNGCDRSYVREVWTRLTGHAFQSKIPILFENKQSTFSAQVHFSNGMWEQNWLYRTVFHLDMEIPTVCMTPHHGSLLKKIFHRQCARTWIFVNENVLWVT